MYEGTLRVGILRGRPRGRRDGSTADARNDAWKQASNSHVPSSEYAGWEFVQTPKLHSTGVQGAQNSLGRERGQGCAVLYVSTTLVDVMSNADVDDEANLKRCGATGERMFP